MSYSYECNVICGVCKEEHVSGEPMPTPIQARISANQKAQSKGWIFDTKPTCPKCSQCYGCPDCAKKVKVDK